MIFSKLTLSLIVVLSLDSWLVMDFLSQLLLGAETGHQRFMDLYGNLGTYALQLISRSLAESRPNA